MELLHREGFVVLPSVLGKVDCVFSLSSSEMDPFWTFAQKNHGFVAIFNGDQNKRLMVNTNQTQ